MLAVQQWMWLGICVLRMCRWPGEVCYGVYVESPGVCESEPIGKLNILFVQQLWEINQLNLWSGRGSNNIFKHNYIVGDGRKLFDWRDRSDARTPWYLKFVIEAEFFSFILFNWVSHEVCLSSGVLWVFISCDIFRHTVRAFWPHSLHFRRPFSGLSYNLDQFVNGPCIFGDDFLC